MGRSGGLGRRISMGREEKGERGGDGSGGAMFLRLEAASG